MNMQKMIKQAQELQKEVENAKREIDNSEFTTTQQGITVVMYGTKKLKDIQIDASLQGDLALIQDLVMLTINDCVTQIQEYTEETLAKFGPGLGSLL